MVKNPPDNAGDIRDETSIPESGRSPGEGHGNPLQYSCLENIMSRGAWLGSIPGLGRFPGGGGGNPLQYSFLENLHGQKILAGYSPWGCKESDTTEQLSTAHRT